MNVVISNSPWFNLDAVFKLLSLLAGLYFSSLLTLLPSPYFACLTLPYWLLSPYLIPFLPLIFFSSLPLSLHLPLFYSSSHLLSLLLYLCLQLTGMVGDGSIEGRQAIEGAVGSKAKAQSLAQARSMRAKTFIAKNKNPKLGNLPKRKFWNLMF